MACMVLGDAFKRKYKALYQKFSWGRCPRPLFLYLLQQRETSNYLLLELVNGLHQDSYSNVFAVMKHLNFQLENEIDHLKISLKGFFTKRCSPQTCSLYRDLPPSSKRIF